jgi:FKBP-type peptidyl-prolyl cis-trans isomerase SlyD
LPASFLNRKERGGALDTDNKPRVVIDDIVVSIDYTLTVDGQVVDTTEDDEPLYFLQGHQNIIPGLERELLGMKIGDSKQVIVAASDAYGEIDPDNIIDVPRSEFPDEIPLEPGTELEVKNSDGEVLSATINEANKDTVKLDFNHPLAGKELTFDITIVDLRQATEEELAHGHAHNEDDEFDYEEDEEFEDDEFDEEIDYEDLDDEDAEDKK